MYGCSAGKLASTLSRPKGQGKRLMKAFWDANPALDKLVSAIEKAYKQKGFIFGLDRRRLKIREERKLLNSLLQHGAAIVFKFWMRKVHEEIVSKYNLEQMIAYHDELQFRFKGSFEDALKIGEEICQVARDTGKLLNIKVPIDAEAKVGKDWKECH